MQPRWPSAQSTSAFAAPKRLPHIVKLAPLQSDAATGRHPVIGWHPDGSLLAVPGSDGEVEALERLNWEPRFSLAGQHKGPVNLAALSPNGEASWRRNTLLSALRPRRTCRGACKLCCLPHREVGNNAVVLLTCQGCSGPRLLRSPQARNIGLLCTSA